MSYRIYGSWRGSMDNQKFEEACEKVADMKYRREGIGTLGEKTLHAVLKHYFEPDEVYHEIKVGSYYADIFNNSGIIEIQTRQWNKLRGKLQHFLTENQVTLVYPIAYTKWLIWVNEETGEVSKKRLSPKRGSAYEIFEELYKIKNFLDHQNIRLCIVYLDIEEYRLLNGWSPDGKRGSWRHDRIPMALRNVIYINSPKDYSLLIPETLSDQFTSKEFSKASGLNLYKAQTALNVLHHVKSVQRVGKKRNMFIYERANP